MSISSFYEKKTCSKCEGTAIFFSEFGKVLCLKCDELEGPIESKNKEDLIPAFVMENLRRVSDKNRRNTDLTAQTPAAFKEISHVQDRNAPCLCGSGKKYKKCECYDKVAERRANVHAAQNDALVERYVEAYSETYVKIRKVFKHQEENKWVRLNESELCKES